MSRKTLKGGLNFEGRAQRALFVSKSAGDGLREHDHQRNFFTWLKYNERKNPVLKFFYAIPNAARRTEWERGRLLDEGMKAGVLDTHLPVARDGYTGFWIEFKAGHNKLTDSQVEWKEFLEREGHKVCVCYGWQDAVLETVRYLKLTDYTRLSTM